MTAQILRLSLFLVAFTLSYQTVTGITQTSIFAGTPTGLAISHNDGITWPKVEFNGSSINSIFGNDNGTIYVAHKDGIFVSENGQDVWKNLTYNITGIRSYYISPSGEDIYIGTQYTNGNLRYTHDGKVWGVKTIGLQSSTVVGLGEIKGTMYALTNNAGLFDSIDGGNKWRLVKANLTTYTGANVLLIANNTIYIGSDMGLWISGDQGVTWKLFGKKDGLSQDDVLLIYVRKLNDESNETIYVGTTSGLSASQDYGKTWRVYLNSTSIVSVHATADGTMYAGTVSSGLSISSDGIIWFNVKKTDGLLDDKIISIYAENRKVPEN